MSSSAAQNLFNPDDQLSWDFEATIVFPIRAYVGMSNKSFPCFNSKTTSIEKLVLNLFNVSNSFGSRTNK